MPAEPSLTRRAVMGAGWLVAWRMVSRALGFISTLVLARLLVPADFGLVAMATTFSGAIDSLSQFSVEDMLVRRVEDDTRLHDAAFTIQLGRAVLTGALIAAGAPFAADWFHEPRLVPVLLVLGGLSVVSGFENIGLVAFRRALRFDVQFRLSLIPRLLQVLTTVGVALEWRSYWALLAGMAVTRLARLIMTYLVHPYRPRLGLRGWRELAGFSGWLWAASLARLVWDRYDPFLIGPAFGAASLGVFQIAQAVAQLPVTELVAPASDVLLAGFSAGQREGSRAVAAPAPLGVAAVMLLTPIVLTLSAGAGDVVRIMLGGALRWSPAVPLVSLFSLTCLISPVGYVVRASMIARGLVRREFGAMICAAAVRVWLIWLAVQANSLPVVAGAAVACAVVETVLFCFQLGRAGALGIRQAGGSSVRLVLAAVVTAIALWRTGLGWVAVPGVPPLGAAMEHLTLLALAGSGLFVGGLGLLWWIAGRPEGAERILLRVMLQAIAPLRARCGGVGNA
ncbi:MAG: oligosaccharide flippase family protein [Acetobacteraceae bacterium]